jgi:hypothetical protein
MGGGAFLCIVENRVADLGDVTDVAYIINGC